MKSPPLSEAITEAALVVGMDSHGLAVARALGSSGVYVVALEREVRPPGTSSRHLRQLHYVPDFSEQHLLPALRQIRSDLATIDKVALFLMNDRQVGIIGRHIAELSKLYRISWADSAKTVLSLQGKDSLELASSRQGLRYPRSVVFNHAAEAHLAFGFVFPIILKPVQPLSSFKTKVIHTESEIEPFLNRYAHDLPILCQEYIEGGDEALVFGQLLLDRGKPLFGLTGRKVLSHPPGQGQATVAELHHDDEVLQLTEQFFAGTDLSGPAALELKRDPAGRYWVIEPTIGRTEFLVELCIAGGFNQPKMEFELACGLPVSVSTTVRPTVWYDTERDPLVFLRLCISERRLPPRGKHATFPYFGHRDAKPLLRAWKATLLYQLKRVARRLGVGA